MAIVWYLHTLATIRTRTVTKIEPTPLHVRSYTGTTLCMVHAHSPAPVLVLLRDDYRVADNPALHAACATGQPVLCAYVQDAALQDASGTRIADWAQAACAQLATSLHEQGQTLFMLCGPTGLSVPALAQAVNATDVFWNRRYDAPGIAADTDVHASLKKQGVSVHSCTGRLLFEPWAIRTQAGQPYRVFTAWWRAARDLPEPPPPLPAPDMRGKEYVPAHTLMLPDGVHLHRVGTKPPALPPGWTSGEKAAHANLHRFIENALADYETQRDRADAPHGTSLLSPYIRVGQISVRQIWHAIRHAADQNPHLTTDAEKFLAELGWRDFAWMQMFTTPDLATRNLRAEFDHMPWRTDAADLAAWQQGQTGFPLVDAGMRQLARTGWMHNRVRMVVASFLTKHLLTDWREGERWFYTQLVDADAAVNAMNWQWGAGTGIDAAPWFRIFNPVGQSEKYDPAGQYIRTWVPELAALDNKTIHTPWKSTQRLKYPAPIVDLKLGRLRALECWKNLPK